MTEDLPEPTALPVQLSPSRAKDFKRCPQLYWFKTIHGCVTPPTVATIKGTMFHTVFERFFDLPAEQRTVDSALDLVAPAWDTMVTPARQRAEVASDSPEAAIRDAGGLWAESFAEDAKRLERAERRATEYAAFLELEEEARLASTGSAVDLRALLIAETSAIVVNYFSAEVEDPVKLRTYTPAERELYLHAEVDGVPLHGFIDRLDHFERADGGDVWYISDYKTGRPHNPRYEDDAYFAMWVYALLLRATRGIVADKVRLIYATAPGRTAGNQTKEVTDERLSLASLELQRLWEELTIAHAENRFEARRARLCDWCYFQTRGCPAFGGDPATAPTDWIDAAFAEAEVSDLPRS